MVFANKKQRMGFFAQLKSMKANHDAKVSMKLQESIKQEQKETKILSSQLQTRIESERVRVALKQQLANQRNQLNDLKIQKQQAQSEAEKFTAKGKAKAALVELVEREKSGFRRIGRGIKAVATSDQTKRALKNIGKQLRKIK